MEIYEELNQPLPPPLLALTGEDLDSVSDARPHSVKSQVSLKFLAKILVGAVELNGFDKDYFNFTSILICSIVMFPLSLQSSSVKSYESGGGGSDNPGSVKCRGDGRRPPALPPTLKEASKRSIVVPKVTRALARTMSEQAHTLQSLQPAAAAAPPPPSKGQS